MPRIPDGYKGIVLGSIDSYNTGEYAYERKGAQTIKAVKLSPLDEGSGFVSYDITIKAEAIEQWTLGNMANVLILTGKYSLRGCCAH